MFAEQTNIVCVTLYITVQAEAPMTVTGFRVAKVALSFISFKSRL
jgi:hypothetical protein